MSQLQEYIQTSREQGFLDSVVDSRYEREIINGLAPFLGDRVPEDMKGLYTANELVQLGGLKGTARDVEKRMPVKITRHFFELAKKSPAIQRLVKASPDETIDLAGSEDPGNQMDYSPVEGLLHKYEMGLMYVVSTCSAHCRFCYREELIARKEITRQDGTVAKKGLATIPEITTYIRAFNAKVAANGGRHPECGREKLREINATAIVKPHAQPHVGIREDRGINAEHVHDRRVTEEHGIKAFRHGESDCCDGLRTGGADAVVAPIGRGAGGIDEGELERAGAIEVRGADRDAPLIVDELWHLGGGRSAEESGATERRDERDTERIHGELVF